MRNNIIRIVIATLILAATIIVGVMGLNEPKQVVRSYTLLNYNMQGGFSHQAYGFLTTEVSPDLVYFPKIISGITGSYRYEFSSDEPVSDVKTQVQVNAVLTRSGSWSKEIVLVPAKELSGGEITFPIDYPGYLELANNISQELGLGNVSYLDITFKVFLVTEANIRGSVINEEFIQTCGMTVGSTTMEWKGPFDFRRKGYEAGISYEQEGLFGYDIEHTSNLLFGSITLSSPVPAVKTPRALNIADYYSPNTIDTMEFVFDYKLIDEPSVAGAIHRVRADVTLSHVDGTRVVFPAISGEEYSDDFTLSIPVDISLLYDIIKKKEMVITDTFEAVYDLEVKVDVNTTVEDPGVVNETISAVLPLRLSSGRIDIGDAVGTTKTGSLKGEEIVENQTRDTLLLIAASLLGLTILAWLFAGWRIWEQRKRSPLLELWETTQNTIDRHKDVLVSMTVLPAIAEGERITPVNSLEELIKLSDALLKPVLHQADGAKHNFCVIDGNVRYEYSVLERPSNSVLTRRFKERKDHSDTPSPGEDEE
ncbi:MAG: hypothetical protein JW762_15950 [Dehalococcoidales bacterium]|nr:hypothetical protein [Dehalococcoidales bacterium]